MTKEEFELLPLGEQKKLIVKDAISQLNAYFYTPCRGTYVALEYKENVVETLDVKENFDKIYNCEVCQLGQAILSTTRFANQLTFENLDGAYVGRPEWESAERLENPKKISSLVAKFFSPREMALMEYTFEGDTSAFATTNFGTKLTGEEESRCRAFRAPFIEYEEVYDEDEDITEEDTENSDYQGLSLAIWENILEYGEFTP